MVNEVGLICYQWLGIWSEGDSYNCYRLIPGEFNDQFLMVLESDDSSESADFDVRLVTIASANTNEFEQY